MFDASVLCFTNRGGGGEVEGKVFLGPLLGAITGWLVLQYGLAGSTGVKHACKAMPFPALTLPAEAQGVVWCKGADVNLDP